MSLNKAYEYVKKNIVINLVENYEEIMSDEELKKAEDLLNSDINFSFDLQEQYDELLEESRLYDFDSKVRVFCKPLISEHGQKLIVAYDYGFLDVPIEVKLSDEDIIYLDCTLRQALEIFKLENEIL